MNGVLIYAFNNSRIDYFRQACWCADRVNKFLDLPVTIVTDHASQADRTTNHNIVIGVGESGGQRIYNPTTDTSADSWINGNRYQSWHLSPYDRTVVLDSDYIVCSDQLLRVFESDISVTAIKDVYDVTGRDDYLPYKYISGRKTLHHHWATVLYFRRDDTARDFFALMSMIKENYNHYADIYKFPNLPFRNDHAVSVALTTVYGHLPDAVPGLPWQMANVFSDVEIQQVDDVSFDLYYTSEQAQKHHRVRISGQDFHFMNKIALEALYAD